MAQAAPLTLVSLEEYLDLEETAVDKHELFRGQIYAMVGGSSNHGEIIDSLAQVCGRALRGKKPCRFISDNRKVVVKEEGSGYYPDGAVAYPPSYVSPSRGTYDNPTIVFEVLSPSTERFDRTDKADDYKSLSSLRDYVLIESEKVRVEVFSRLDEGGWVQRVYLPGTVAHVPSVGIDLPLSELYENAIFEEVLASPIEED